MNSGSDPRGCGNAGETDKTMGFDRVEIEINDGIGVGSSRGRCKAGQVFAECDWLQWAHQAFNVEGSGSSVPCRFHINIFHLSVCGARGEWESSIRGCK